MYPCADTPSCGLGPKGRLPKNGPGRTFFRTDPAIGALRKIHHGKVIFHGNGLLGTDFGAKAAAQASYLANLAHILSLFRGAARYKRKLRSITNLDDIFRADIHAKTAAHTQGIIHHSNTVYDMNGIELADLHTGSKAKASVFTSLGPPSGGYDRLPAIPNSEIIVFPYGFVRRSSTFDESHLPLHFSRGNAHNRSHIPGHRGASGYTKIDLRLSRRYGLRIGITPHVTAPSTIDSRKNLTNLRHPGIHGDRAFLGSISQKHSENQPQNPQSEGGKQQKVRGNHKDLLLS